jgi:SAM-dependent methyltransferase
VFVLADVIQEDLGQISYGIVTSEAGDFPIVEGILRLQVDEYRAPIVEHVRQNRLAQALTIALDDWPFHGRARAAINFASGFAFRRGFNSAAEQLSRLKRSLARTVTDGNATFAEIATKLSPGHVAHWEIYRFSMPGFLSTFPLAHLVRSEGQVLNFACGSGQESFVIARMWPNVKIVCADNSFCSLYMAKKYFAPEAIYVSLNGDYLLPFESGQFSTIFSSDTLHIIDSKLNLAQEFKRKNKEKAVTLLPHLHNRLVSPYAKSLTPRGYRQLFRDVEVRMMPDDQVVSSLILMSSRAPWFDYSDARRDRLQFKPVVTGMGFSDAGRKLRALIEA